MAHLTIHTSPQGPVTHVLVIGVGTYPHLKYGSGPPAIGGWDLKQLTTSPRSALYFIDWLLKRYKNDDAPLATIEHVISAPHQVTDASGLAQASAEPTMANILAAYTRWFNRANSDERNVALFYFCGHGLHNNNGTALLAADFANPDFQNLAVNAIHVEATVTNMLACKAKRQCFFIDSCRTSNVAWQEMMVQPGQALGMANVHDVSEVDQPVFFATGRTRRATAPAGQVSLFTKALVDALESLAADNPDGDSENGEWVVSTADVVKAVQAAVELELMTRPWLTGPQKRRPICNFGGDGSHFELHWPEPPIRVPMMVDCDPKILTGQATFDVSLNGTVVDSRMQPAPHPWISRQEPKSYQVGGTLPDGRRVSKLINLHPPVRKPVLSWPPQTP